MFKHSMKTLVAASLILMSVGCASTQGDDAPYSPDGDEWMDTLPSDVLASVGMAKIIGNKAVARRTAEADGRAKIAEAVEANIQSLMTNWFKEAGDNLDEDTLSSYINNEGIVRQVTDVKIVGASPRIYRERDGYQYVLMVVDDPAKWTELLGQSVKQTVLKDNTLFKTQVMKDEFEAKLDAAINRDAEAVAEKTAAIAGEG